MRKVVLLVLLGWMSLVSLASEGAAEALLQLGFENVRVKQSEGVTYAAFENNVYRGNYRGLGVALTALSAYSSEKIVLVALENDVPRLRVSALRVGETWNVTTDYEVSGVMQQLKGVKSLNRSAWKVDVVAYPQVMLDNHLFHHLFNAAVDLAPAVEMGLWKGASLTAQVVFPIWNNFKSERDYIRPGIIRLTQDVVATDRWNVSLSAGIFNEGRTGLHAEAVYHWNNRLDIGLQAGYTGLWYIDEGDWILCEWDRAHFLGKLSYYEPSTHLQFELRGGRFAYGDCGVRADCTRHFGEYALGVYGVYTDGDHNAGFHFSIPFGGKKKGRKDALRVRLPEYFDWEYSMVSFYDYAEQNKGCIYETRPDENRSAHYWQAAYVERFLERYLNGKID